MLTRDLLVKAARLFHSANVGSKTPSRRHSKAINKLLHEYWRRVEEDGRKHRKVTIDAAHLYTLLHQATQTLP